MNRLIDGGPASENVVVQIGIGRIQPFDSPLSLFVDLV